MSAYRFALLFAGMVLAPRPPLLAQKKPITVVDMVRQRPAPRSSSVVWRPDGQAFSFIKEGKLWLYQVSRARADLWLSVEDLQKAVKGPERPAVAPFDWQNRRVHSAEPQWFPDGSKLLFPAENATFILSPGQPSPVKTLAQITGANTPVLSPDGHSVLFLKQFDLFVLDLETGHIVQLTTGGSETLRNGQLDWVYPEELDLGKAFWWSPDSKSVAYMQFDVSREPLYPHEDLLSKRAIYEPQRYPQAGSPNATVRVGVVPASGGETRWADLGSDRDQLVARVTWLPDSRRLAVQHLNRVQDHLDLDLIDIATGRANQLLSESDKTWINVSDDLRFLQQSSRFLWSSEKSGFRHLYLYSLDGKQIRQLTSGKWQVSRLVAVDEPNGLVYFTSTEASPLEDHLYRVKLEGGAPQRLTTEPGVHSIQMPDNGTAYLDTFSSTTNPPQTGIYNASGKKNATLDLPDTSIAESFNVLPSETVELKAADGTLLYGRVIKPAQFHSGRVYPAVVLVYGGPGAQSIRNAWGGLGFAQVLAHRGFVVWQLDNRGATGRGHQFESHVYRELGKTELEDQRAGVEKLISLGYVDRNRVGIFGWSFGGYMTLYSLLHAPGVFKAGIAGAPVTDWHNYDTIYTERYMGLPEQNQQGYRNSSNVLAASNLQGELMIVCNYEDDNVLFQNTMQMMTALHRARKPFQFVLYPQKTHGVTGDLTIDMYTQMLDFFVRHLHP